MKNTRIVSRCRKCGGFTLDTKNRLCARCYLTVALGAVSLSPQKSGKGVKKNVDTLGMGK